MEQFDLKAYLTEILDNRIANEVIEKWQAKSAELYHRFEPQFTTSQNSTAEKAIYPYISIYLILRSGYMEPFDAFVMARKCFDDTVRAKQKFFVDMGRSEDAFLRFKKAFMSMANDAWDFVVETNDNSLLEVTMNRCIYRDICVLCGVPEFCDIFCDGDYLVYGMLDKVKFTRQYTLGKGGSCCDFHFKNIVS